jgi:uncharacterized membrane protein
VPDVYQWALLCHLVGAILFFAGLAVAAAGQLAARRRRRPSEVALLLGTARWGVPLVGLGALLALAGGFWLVAETPYGFEGWVVAALVLFAVSAVAGAVGGQAPKRARRLAERLAGEGDEPSADLDALQRQPVADALNAVAAVAAVVILVLMVWKPGG